MDRDDDDPSDECSRLLRAGGDHLIDRVDFDLVDEDLRQSLFGDRSYVTIGRYRVDGRIGRGGMGVVYSGYDPQLQRKVAIKRVRGHLTGRDGRVRDALMRDARSAARVSHPRVVEIYDCVVEQEQLHVVMELVEGSTLEQWLASPRSWREIVEQFLAAGEGLAAVHAHGVVHRDFKPANVLIGSDGRVRVADFGLARVVDELRETEPDGPDGFSSGGGAAGTVMYMAPEQFEVSVVSPQADQFAYCNALYRALFHQAPFEGNSPEAYTNSLREGRGPLVPSHRGVPRALARTVLRGLCRDPQGRHRSMDALLAELRSVLHRRRRVMLASGGVLTVVLATLLGHWWPSEGIEPCSLDEPPWSAEQRRAVREALDRGSSVEDQLMTTLDDYAVDWVAARQDACAATRVRGEQSDELMDLRMACLDRQRVSLSVVMDRLSRGKELGAGVALGLVGDQTVSDCQREQVREQATRARAFAARTDHSVTPQLEPLRRSLVSRLASARAEAAMERHQHAIEQVQGVAQAAEDQGLRYLQAEALWVAGRSGLEVARTAQQQLRARADLERALPLSVESGSQRLTALVLLSLVQAKPPLGSSDMRRQWLDLARAHCNTLLEPGSLSVHIELARAALALEIGAPDHALVIYRRTRARAPSELLRLQAASGVGNVLYHKGELEVARRVWEELVAEFEHFDPADPMRAEILRNLSLVARDQERLDDALALLERADQVYAVSHEHRTLARIQVRVDRARILRELGRLDQAHGLLHEVLDALQSRGLSAGEVRAQALDELTEVALARGERELARWAAQEHLQVAEGQGSHSRSVAKARMMLARVYLDTGELDRARDLIIRALDILIEEPRDLLRAEAEFRGAQVAHALGDGASARRLLLETGGTFSRTPNSEQYQAQVRQWASERGYD